MIACVNHGPVKVGPSVYTSIEGRITVPPGIFHVISICSLSDWTFLRFSRYVMINLNVILIHVYVRAVAHVYCTESMKSYETDVYSCMQEILQEPGLSQQIWNLHRTRYKLTV